MAQPAHGGPSRVAEQRRGARWALASHGQCLTRCLTMAVLQLRSLPLREPEVGVSGGGQAAADSGVHQSSPGPQGSRDVDIWTREDFARKIQSHVGGGSY